MAERYPCPACGAELSWTPGQGALSCPYCGHTQEDSAAADAPHVPTEHRLDQAAMLATKGWGTEVQEVRCETCGAISEHDPKIAASSCAFCGSDQLQVYSADEALIRPESVLPFAVDKDKAAGDFRGWVSGLWFRPNALKKLSQLAKIDGVYVPCWTFDAQASSHWTAEAGHYYYETEHYTEMVNGKPQRKTRKVRKTRWVPASGSRRDHFDDVLISASTGLEQKLFDGLLPFDLSQLKGYDTQYLAGFTAERYQLGLDEGFQVAKGKMDREIHAACVRDCPGDTQRNMHVSTRYSDETFKHILLPVWIAAYDYRGTVYRYLVNGQTGKLHGTAPYSAFKIAAAVLAAVLLIAAIALLLQSR